MGSLTSSKLVPVPQVDYSRIAQYYESRGEYDKAADMWTKCDQAPRAVQLYLKVGGHRPLAAPCLVGIEYNSRNLLLLITSGIYAIR